MKTKTEEEIEWWLGLSNEERTEHRISINGSDIYLEPEHIKKLYDDKCKNTTQTS